MANVEKLSVALTPEMAVMMRQAVESGEYASASEVMREALREWKLRRTQREHAIAELRKAYQEGLDSGPMVDGDAAFAEIGAKIDTKSNSTRKSA